jgi:ribosome-associated heat shock protein Hsp15
MAEPAAKVRIDKWLWAARFFKTRSLAADAVDGGKVLVAGERVKPARGLKAGDSVEVRLGPYRWQVTVLGLSDRRGPAEQARLLYSESEQSRAEREKLSAQVRAARALGPMHRGRPTKKLRRQMDALASPEDAAEDDGDGWLPGPPVGD